MNGVKTFEITVKKNSGKNKDLFFKIKKIGNIHRRDNKPKKCIDSLWNIELFNFDQVDYY